MTDMRDTGDALLPALDGEPGPALPIDDGAMRAMITAAIDGGGPAGPATGGGLSVAVKATLVAVAVGAIAVAVIALSGVLDRDESPAPVAEQAAIEPPTEPEVAVAPAPEPIEIEPEPIEIEPEVVEPAPPTRPASPRREPAAKSPDDLLRMANEARKQRAWSDADAIYRRVWKEHAGTRAAYVARVASAQLALSKLDRPSAALAGFRAALRQDPDGFLTEEARFGVAQALRALGKEDEERAALERFVVDYPGSALAPRARARLEALNGGDAP